MKVESRKVNLLLNHCATYGRSSHNIRTPYQGNTRVTACFHQCVKLRVQTAQVSTFTLMRFLLIPLRERQHHAMLQSCRISYRYTTTYSRFSSKMALRHASKRSGPCPDVQTLITLEQFIAAIINGHGSDSETSLCSSLISWHTASEQRE